MGIDYVVALECAPKERLGVEGIVNLVKARSRAEMIRAMSRQKGDDRPPSEITFVVALNRNGKIEQQEVSVQTLLDQAAALDAHNGACAECPANRDRPEGYGCYNSINYPIEPDTEKWLLARLPDRLDESSAAGYLFKSALEDFAWDGAQAAAMRAQGDTFFRLREAPRRSWPGGITVTADQLFHMMFHVGHLGATHSKLMCMFFGLIVVGDDDQARTQSVEIESGNAEAMVDFLNTLGFAQSEDLDVMIDG
jgi:hypothetical protein